MAPPKKQLIFSRIATWQFLNQTEQIVSTKEVVGNLQACLLVLQEKLNDSDLHPYQRKKLFLEKEITEKIKILWADFLSQLELGYFSSPPLHQDEVEIKNNVFLNEQ